MPTHAFTYNLQALVNFELFSYTLKLVHSINELVHNPSSLPAAMRDGREVSHPQIYLDFSTTPGGKSQEMARYCVRRDIEAYQQFHFSNLLLRQLDGYVDQLRRIPAHRAQIEAALDGVVEGPQYLQGILNLRSDTHIGMWIESRAATDEGRIWQENVAEYGEEDGMLRTMLDEVTAGSESDLERVVSILVECQRKSALEHYMQWYWSVGGLTKPHGILVGSPKGRSGWRYAPSNDLLAVLVQLAAISISTGDEGEPRDTQHPQPIRLQDFLSFLERRFGILIDRPPEPFTGAEAAAAARENLRAMLRRLRQMGIFSDLSDDFTVQRLQPPYGRDQRARVEA